MTLPAGALRSARVRLVKKTGLPTRLDASRPVFRLDEMSNSNKVIAALYLR